VRGPAVAAGSHVQAITGNIDLAPTFAALGDTTLTDSPDGRSLVPFLQGRAPSASDGRQAYLLEHWTTSLTPQSRSGAGELEPDDLDQSNAATGGGATGSTTSTSIRAGKASLSNIPEYQGLRTARYTYVEYSTGEKELYDVIKDPNELTNLAATASPALLATLHARLEQLRSCKAEGCRTAENKPLDLPS
jgi:arylsulfatase A-like enzyme